MRRSTSASESPTAIRTTGGLAAAQLVRGSGRPRTERTTVGPIVPSESRAARRTTSLSSRVLPGQSWALQGVERVGLEGQGRVEVLEEAPGEERDVALALAQRRQVDDVFSRAAS